MLALVGLATVVILLAAILSRAMSPLVALIVVPVTAALVAGSLLQGRALPEVAPFQAARLQPRVAAS